MTSMTLRALSRGQRRALAFAVAVVIAGMGMGFASSFTTLYAAALAHHWDTPAFLPLGVDTGIVAYVVLDHLAVTLGARSRWLHLAALALAGFTVWMNAAVAGSGGTAWRVIHAAMPALWVLGVEALRFMWHRLHDTGTAAGRIPRGRWLASPVPTLFLWRRMKLLNVTSWQRMAALEDARLYIRDRVQAARSADPDLTVPDEVRRAVRSGRLPAVIAKAVDLDLSFGGTARMEEAADEWTAARLTLRDEVRAALEARRRDITRAALEASPEVTPAPPVQDPPEAASGQPAAHASGHASGQPAASRPVTRKAAPRRKAPATPRLISDADLKRLVRSEFEADPAVSVNAAAKNLGRSRDRVRPLLAEVRREAGVVPIGERRQA